MSIPRPQSWLYSTPQGLYCVPGDFHIDPAQPVDRALITHGHGDHARPGHRRVLATRETADIMQLRLGAEAAGEFAAARMGEPQRINDVTVRFVPAGHIFGSAQIVLEYAGSRVVISGDYKRTADPTCPAFEPVDCDLFITEATFGLPVFRHGSPRREIGRLLASLGENADRCHLLGVYGLGKCQRVITLLREAGFDAPIYLHGALIPLCHLYERAGIPLGDLRPVSRDRAESFQGRLVLCPPSAMADRWSRRFGDAVTCFASGWMRVRALVRQRRIELPLVISDHADWPEILATIDDTGASEIWVTHGHDEALLRQLALMGLKGRALALVGFEEEAE
jgi:putative mRNA 3-end processing factor